jgi:hypothetical protein
MKKILLFIGLIVGVGVLLKLVASKVPSIDWEQKFEAMPDNAPPKWMFSNISAIRSNTDRIIDLLQGPNGAAGPDAGDAPGAAEGSFSQE